MIYIINCADCYFSLLLLPLLLLLLALSISVRSFCSCYDPVATIPPLSHTNIVLFLHVQFIHLAFCKSVTKALKVMSHRTSLYHDLAEGWNVTRFFAPSYCTLEGAQVAGNTHALFLTQWRRFLPETLTVPQLVNRCSTFYGKPTFITAFTTARHLSLSWAISIQLNPSHPNLLKILILCSHLRLGLPRVLFPSGFQVSTWLTYSYDKVTNQKKEKCVEHITSLRCVQTLTDLFLLLHRVFLKFTNYHTPTFTLLYIILVWNLH